MSNNFKGFVEVTLLAGVLFAVPAGYYYGRENILNVQNKVYNKLFSIKESDYKKVIEKQRKELEEEAKLIEEEQKLNKES